MCEWCRRLVHMPVRWNKHAFSWADNFVWNHMSMSDWKKNKWERKYWRRAQAWVEDKAKIGYRLGSRMYGRAYGDRYWNHE